jgi:hypothetical protein
MRVFRSAQHYGLPIQRGSFTRGQPPWRYLRPLNANLFLSTHLSDVRAALDAGVPAAQVYPHSALASEAHPHEVRPLALAAVVALDVGLDALQGDPRASGIPVRREGLARGEGGVEEVVRPRGAARAAEVGAHVGAKRVLAHADHLREGACGLGLTIDHGARVSWG